MCQKIKVSREIVEAYYEILKKNEGNTLSVVYDWSEELLPHKSDNPLSKIDWNTLLSLITLNFEVEKTPAELLEDFENEHTSGDWHFNYAHGVVQTIKFFKENFKIKGIND